MAFFIDGEFFIHGLLNYAKQDKHQKCRAKLDRLFRFYENSTLTIFLKRYFLVLNWLIYCSNIPINYLIGLVV